MNFANFEDVFSAQITAAISIFSIGFVALMPGFIMANPSIIKSHRTDPKYYNFCQVATGLRILFLVVSMMGLRDHLILLSLNAFGLSIFAMLEGNFKRISNEYFKH